MSRRDGVVAHVLHRLYLAGAEVLAADLARQLGDQHRFIFLCLDEIGPLGQQLIGEGFEVVDLARRPGVDWSVARRLRQEIRKRDVGLLHAHQYTPFFYAAVARRWSAWPRILFTEHGRHYPDYRRTKRVIANKFLLRANDRVTAVGGFVKQALVDHEGIAADRIKVIYNGIDPRKFSVDDQDVTTRSAVRQELGVSDDQVVLIQVARFHPVKDHATAIRAFAQAVGQYPNAVLVLVGDGQLRADSEALAQELGVQEQVRFLGVRQDIPRLMAGSDVFLLSSLSEGVSVTLLEAMGCGLPIAATEVGGNPEIVAHGKTGLLSPRGDVLGLARNMVTLCRDPQLREQMGRAGRERLVERFTQQQMHDGYAQLYQQTLADR